MICIGAGAVVYTEALNLFAWRLAQSAGEAHPNLSILPVPLQSIPLAQLNGVRVVHFGFSFQVPWKDIAQDRVTKDWAASISFRDGGGLLIFNPSAQVDGATTMHGSTLGERKTMESILGKLALSSNYEFMAAEVEATPDQVKWWNSRRQATRNAILLINKSGDLRSSHEMYKLASGKLRGFQFGDPAVAPYIVQLDLFDPSDRHYRIFVTPSKQNQAVISQAQINALIASIQ